MVKKDHVLKSTKYLLTIVLSVLVITAIVKAGTLTQSLSPTAQFYTLTDIYNRLNTNVTATEADHVFAPSATPAGTFYTLTQIYDAIPTIDATKVLNTATYLGVTGSIATQTLSAANDTVSAGYYTATTLATVDTDLVTGNVKSGITIFGVAGDSNVVNTSTGTATAGNILAGAVAWVDGASVSGTMTNVGTQIITPTTTNTTITAGYHGGSGYCEGDADLTSANIANGVNLFGVTGNLSGAVFQTGDTLCYNASGTSVSCTGTGQSGEFDGTTKSYTADGCGGTGETVLDDNSGLCWQYVDQATKDWETALAYCDTLNLGGNTDWHLPTYIELSTLVDFACITAGGSCYGINRNTALDWATTGSTYLWSSTTVNSALDNAYNLYIPNGAMGLRAKTGLYNVRCVRVN